MRHFNFNQMAPILKNVTDGIVKTVTSKGFRRGIAVSLPSMIALTYEIYKLKRESQEKELSYAKALTKHQAVIKQLEERTDLDRERQDRLLAYDSELKNEMAGLQEKIRDLKEQIIELEKQKAKE